MEECLKGANVVGSAICSQLLWEYSKCRFSIAIIRIQFQGFLQFLLPFLQVATFAKRKTEIPV